MCLALFLSVAIGAVIMFVLVDGVLQDPFAKLFVSFFTNVIRLEENSALYLYHFVIRQQKETYMLVGFCLLYTIVLIFMLFRVTDFLDEVEEKADYLLEEGDDRIVFSRQLQPLEEQFNEVKTSLRRRAYEARVSEQQKNDLIVYLAHDLKTPLTSVIGYLSLLVEAPDMPAAQRAKYTGIALDKAYRLEDLIDEFFEITRFNLQNIVINEERVDLTMMLNQLTDEFFPELGDKKLHIDQEIQDELWVMGDRDKLARVLDNLLRNAVHYSTPGTAICLTAKEKPGKVIISLDNEGKDIPAHKLQHLFEKFYRLDESRRSDTGGAGLGLAIAKEIVERHKGKISVTSGGGHTVFTVQLPKQS